MSLRRPWAWAEWFSDSSAGPPSPLTKHQPQIGGIALPRRPPSIDPSNRLPTGDKTSTRVEFHPCRCADPRLFVACGDRKRRYVVILDRGQKLTATVRDGFTARISAFLTGQKACQRAKMRRPRFPVRPLFSRFEPKGCLLDPFSVERDKRKPRTAYLRRPFARPKY